MAAKDGWHGGLRYAQSRSIVDQHTMQCRQTPNVVAEPTQSGVMDHIRPLTQEIQRMTQLRQCAGANPETVVRYAKTTPVSMCCARPGLGHEKLARTAHGSPLWLRQRSPIAPPRIRHRQYPGMRRRSRTYVADHIHAFRFGACLSVQLRMSSILLSGFHRR